MHVEAWGLNHSLYLPYVMHGRPSVAASFSLRPQDSLWDGAHDARLTGDVVDEILGGKVDRADWDRYTEPVHTWGKFSHKDRTVVACGSGRNRPVAAQHAQVARRLPAGTQWQRAPS